MIRTIDGPAVRCSLHMWDCSLRASLAGGLQEHHRHPVSMGGAEHPDELLVLCSLHHTRIHAITRAYVERGLDVRTVRWFSPAERATARYAVESWAAAGRPRITGWSTPAAAVLP